MEVRGQFRKYRDVMLYDLMRKCIVVWRSQEVKEKQ